jgi:hypothetical protein
MKISTLILFSFLILTNLSIGQVGINDHIKNDFPLVYSIINRQAKDKYPNDHVKQMYVIKEQCNACYDILYPNEYIQNLRKDIPPDVWTKTWTDTFNKFSKKDLKNAPCNNIEVNKNKLDCMYSYALVDWVLVKFEIKEQIDAYKKMH